MADEVRLGIAGLGMAFRMKLGSGIFNSSDRVRITAGADVRPEERERFGEQLDIETFASVEDMCKSNSVDAVWVFTPHHVHAESTITVAEHGKHVLVEKPMCVTMDEANRMVDAVEHHGVTYIHGHSKLYLAPMQAMARVINSGRLGRVYGINSWYFNDWMRRPLWSASDMDPDRGGGPLYWLGPHHVDIVRWLGGGLVRSVRASMGRHLPPFDVEGNYSAFLDFEDGPSCTMTLSSYGYFDTAELTWGMSEGGTSRPEASLFGPRNKNLRTMTNEEKYAISGYSTEDLEQRLTMATTGRRRGLDFFGLTVVSCEKGDIRQSPEGLYVYTEDGREELPIPADLPPSGELVELAGAVLDGRKPLLDADWARASIEVCTAMLQSSKERREIPLSHQVPSPVRPSGVIAAP